MTSIKNVSGTIFLGSASGLYVSYDNCENWELLDDLSVNRGGDVLEVIGNDLFTGNKAGIFKSTDNGNSWELKSKNLISQVGFIPYIYFLKSYKNNLLTTVGGWTTLFQSTDGGNEWKSLANPGSEDKNRLFISVRTAFENDKSILASGRGLHRSDDGGNTWKEITKGFDVDYYSQLLGLRGDTAFARSYQGRIFRTTDNGENWEKLEYGTLSGDIKHAKFYGDLVFVSATNNGIIMTSDLGDTWERLNVPTLAIRNFLFKDNHLIAFDFYGNVYSTPDFGKTWLSKNEGLPSPLYITDIEINDEYLFIAADSGIYRSPLEVILSKEDYKKSDVKIFPNPATDILKLQSESVYGKIEIFDFNGRKVKEINQFTQSKEIDISVLPPGSYLIRSGNTSSVFIKE